MMLNLTCPHCGHDHENKTAPSVLVGWIGACIACGELAIVTDDGRFRRLQIFDLAAMSRERISGLLHWHRQQLADTHLSRYLTARYRSN